MARKTRPLVEVEGARELRRSLRAAGDDLEDLKATNQRAADIAAGGARRLVPRKTGKLAGTIRASGTKTAGIIRAGKKRVPYAGQLEWGWPQKAITPQNRPWGGPIKAQPFLDAGARATESTWLPLYADELSKILDKVEGK